MIEMPSGVALLAIIAGILVFYVLIWGAVSNVAFWPRLVVRLLATAALILLPLAFVAMNEIESRRDAGAPAAGVGSEREEAEPKITYRDGWRERAPAAPRGDGHFDDAGEAPAAPPASTAPPEARGLAREEPAAQPRAAIAADEKFDVVPVFYGTNRLVEPNPLRLAYGSGRAETLAYGRALVTVPHAHKVPNIERPWQFTVPFTSITFGASEDPEKHFMVKEITTLSKAEFIARAKERLAAATRLKEHALVFVHGFNTTFDNALYRTAQIAYDLAFDGAPFLFSWPSNGRVSAYRSDRENAEAADFHMLEFLQVVCRETGAKSVSIIAHSLGNKPLLAVLKHLRLATPSDITISELILAAPDVDRDQFQNFVRDFSGIAKGVTLYAASNDRALQASQRAWATWWNWWSGGVARAGEVGANGPLILKGVDSIDVTAASTDMFALNHAGFARNTGLVDDMRLLIESGKHPPDQRFASTEQVSSMTPVETEQGVYWRYAPRPAAPSP